MTNLKVLKRPADLIAAEPGIPIPKRVGLDTSAKYPWKTMEVGDSFALPPNVNAKNFSCQASVAGKVNGRRFTTRQMPDGSRRCWRIA